MQSEESFSLVRPSRYPVCGLQRISSLASAGLPLTSKYGRGLLLLKKTPTANQTAAVVLPMALAESGWNRCLFWEDLCQMF